MRSPVSPTRVLVKALCLFVIINFAYGAIAPQVSALSAYNVVFPGRTRLPFGISGDPYTVSVDDVNAMFASHVISSPKRSDEFRVVLLGDSSVWGEDLGAYEIISEQWNRLDLSCEDKRVRAYDLGYPHPSVIKDLVILDKAMEYKPDLIIWFVTLNTLFSQRVNPFLVANRDRAVNVMSSYDILIRQGGQLVRNQSNFLENTLVGQRSKLARQIKLQLMGIIWTATRSDTSTLSPDAPTDFNVDEDPAYRGLQPGEDLKSMLQLDAITAGYGIAGSVPVLIVNEPIFLASEAYTRVRYNPGYPRWAYDQYREALTTQAQKGGWHYLDLWDRLPQKDFSDAGLHRNIQGERSLIGQINPALESIACKTSP